MAKKQSLMILSSNPTSRDQLGQALTQLKGEFEGLDLIAADINDMYLEIDEHAQGVIIDVDEWKAEHEDLVPKIRQIGYRGPILVLAKRDQKKLTGASKVADEVIFLDKPYDPKEMNGFARRMVLAPLVAHRKYKRHDTNEQADLTIEGTSITLKCAVKNISKGGALLELSRAVQLKAGDAVVLHLQLGKIKKTHVIKARVAWANSRGTSVGIEFVNTLGAL